MIREQAADERIREWLHEEADGQLPDWVLHRTFDRTRAQRQLRSLPRWRFPTLSNPVRIILVAAASLAALLGISYSGSQSPAPPGPCSTPAIPTSPAAAASSTLGSSPVEFLWAGRGPADDPMEFDTAAQMDGLPEAGAIAVDPQCRVWVADTKIGHDRFAIFAPDGTFMEYWGSSGTGVGQFLLRNTYDGVGAVAFAPDASFYVLDVGNLRIQHFAEDRTFLGSWGGWGSDPGRYQHPAAIAVDANGVVYVLDDGRDVVETYNSDGNVLGSLKPNARYAADGLAVDARGDVYVVVCCTGVNSVQRRAPDGTLLATIGAFGPVGNNPQMTAVAVDAAGRVFAVRSGSRVEGDRVRVYGPDGALLATFGGDGSADGEFGRGWIQGIALDGQGNVYVTDPGQQSLMKFRLLPPLAS